MVHRLRPSKAIALLLAVLATAPLAAATATGVVGALGSTGIGSVDPGLTIDGATLIDLARPATSAGSYDSATVLWAGGAGNPCAAAFKVKFYRPSFVGSPNLAFVAERGPFDAQRGLITVPLSPAVPLLAGDLIAVTELLGSPCGAVALVASDAGAKTFAFAGDDPSPDVTICRSSSSLQSQSLAAIATAGGTEVRSGIVTGVGSAHGASNSNFKTSMQLVNPGPGTISGRLVFHPMGQAGSPSDPSIPYSIPFAQVTSFDDVVGAIGVSGLGSIDVMVDASYPPLIVTRVFNDAGAAGTAGFVEPTVRPGDPFVLEAGESAFLVAPADLTKYRMNIGIRTLEEGASIAIKVFGVGDGFDKSYSANFFDQRTAEDFLNENLVPNEIIDVVVILGRAIVYSVSVDNVTNDTSFQLATRSRF